MNTVSIKSNLIKKILLKDVMRNPAIMLNVHEEFHMVEKTLRENQIKHLPVNDNEGKLVGIITLSDLYRTCAPRRDFNDGSYFYTQEQLDSYILYNVMTKDPFHLKADNNLFDAMTAMVRGGYGCIPIVDNNHRIIGIITQTDIVRVVTNLFSS